jgi:molybdate transport system substrate-binding protein
MWAILLVFLGLFPAQAQSVRVVAASDLQHALPELVRAFSAQNPGVRVELIFGSSGKLYAQITQGLPADLFFSAEALYPRLLEERGLAEPKTLRLYALGRLALWLDRRLGLRPGLEALKDPRITRLAMANPVHAPYGRAAVTLLEHHGLLKRRDGTPIPDFTRLPWEAIPWERLTGGVEAYWDTTPLRQGKPGFAFVYGENVSHAAQLALAGTRAGLLALSLVLQESLARSGVYWVAPPGSHLPLEQAYVVLKGRARPEVMAFYRFVASPEGRGILKRSGFLIPGE